jgi:hypothetical protein
MLTQDLQLTADSLKEKLKDSKTEFLIINAPEGYVFVHKKYSTVFVVPHDEE